jgi:hypothetical protein
MGTTPLAADVTITEGWGVGLTLPVGTGRRVLSDSSASNRASLLPFGEISPQRNLKGSSGGGGLAPRKVIVRTYNRTIRVVLATLSVHSNAELC